MNEIGRLVDSAKVFERWFGSAGGSFFLVECAILENKNWICVYTRTQNTEHSHICIQNNNRTTRRANDRKSFIYLS